LLRVGGKIAGDAALEASVIGRESLSRVVAETRCWYEVEGIAADSGAVQSQPQEEEALT
jgi:hypothetical protein